MIKGLIFDLDGTLTEPGLIDFAAIRQAIGCPPHETILEHLELLRRTDYDAWVHGLDEVDRHERDAAARTRPARNLEQFLRWLDESGLRRAIITRNSRATAHVTLGLLGLDGWFDPVVAREDALPKPAPDGVLKITKAWELEPGEVVLVGDFKHDIEAGVRAGAWTAFYTGHRTTEPDPRAHFVVHDLLELPAIVGGIEHAPAITPPARDT